MSMKMVAVATCYMDVASTPAEDPWALEAIQGDSAMQQRYWTHH